MARMTEEQFTSKQAEVFTTYKTPDEFKGTLSSMAWARGHSAGLEEVASILEDLASDLADPIKAYGERKSLEGAKGGLR